MASSSFIKSNILILVFTFSGIFLNFFSQLILAYFYGTSVERDVFFSATVIVTYVVTIITTSVSVIFLPSFIEVRTNRTEEGTTLFSRSFFIIYFLALLIICWSIFYGAGYLVSAIYPLLDLAAQGLLVDLLKVLVFSILFQGLTGFLTIFYNADNKFFISALNPIINTAAIILAVYLLHPTFGIISVAIGTIMGNAVNVLLILPQLKPILKRPFRVSFKDEKLRSILKVIFFLLLTNIIIRLAPVIERTIASGLDKGSISYLGYANQIVLVLITVTSSSIATTIFPIFASSWAEKDFDKLSRNFISSIRVILLLSLPIASVFIVYGQEIIHLTFERGAFGPEATRGVSRAIGFLMVFFIFASLGNIVFKIFYIAKKTKVFISIALIEIGLYIVLAYWLVPLFSYIGLAIALSVSTCVNLLLGILYLVARLKIIRLKTISFIFAEFLAIFFLHICIMLGAEVVFTGLKNDLLRLLAELVVGNIIFLALVHYLFKNKELTIITNLIFQKLNKAS